MSYARLPITTAPVVLISSCSISVFRNASKSGYRRLTSPWRSFINPSSDMVAPIITFPIKNLLVISSLRPTTILLAPRSPATPHIGAQLAGLPRACAALALVSEGIRPLLFSLQSFEHVRNHGDVQGKERVALQP